LPIAATTPTSWRKTTTLAAQPPAGSKSVRSLKRYKNPQILHDIAKSQKYLRKSFVNAVADRITSGRTPFQISCRKCMIRPYTTSRVPHAPFARGNFAGRWQAPIHDAEHRSAKASGAHPGGVLFLHLRISREFNTANCAGRVDAHLPACASPFDLPLRSP
jgi:hypothetical protein